MSGKKNKKIPHGVIKQVADNLKLSESSVRLALKGKSNSINGIRILDEVAKVVTELKKKENEAMKVINNLLL